MIKVLMQEFEAAIPVTWLTAAASEGDVFLWHYSVNRNYINRNRPDTERHLSVIYFVIVIFLQPEMKRSVIKG